MEGPFPRGDAGAPSEAPRRNGGIVVRGPDAQAEIVMRIASACIVHIFGLPKAHGLPRYPHGGARRGRPWSLRPERPLGGDSW